MNKQEVIYIFIIGLLLIVNLIQVGINFNKVKPLINECNCNNISIEEIKNFAPCKCCGDFCQKEDCDKEKSYQLDNSLCKVTFVETVPSKFRMLQSAALLIIIFGLAISIIGFSYSIILEYFVGAKIPLILFILLIGFLAVGSIHYHDCSAKAKMECEKAHLMGFTYDYCTNGTSLISGKDLSMSTIEGVCKIHTREKCSSIPSKCLVKKDEFVDGACIPWTKWCWVLVK